MMTGLLLSDDLLFASKVTATARAQGLAPIAICRTPARLLEKLAAGGVGGVILDLQHPGLDVAAVVALAGALSPRPQVVGYGSHVDAETLKAARQAGCGVVLPRSRFAERLEADLGGWLQNPEPGTRNPEPKTEAGTPEPG